MCEIKIPVQNYVCSWNFIQFLHDFILFGSYSSQSIHGRSSPCSANGRKARAITFAHRTYSRLHRCVPSTSSSGLVAKLLRQIGLQFHRHGVGHEDDRQEN